MLFTDGPARLLRKDGERLAAHGITVRNEKIARLEGTDGRMTGVVFENVPGLFVAGDATHDVPLVIVAAAEGAKAGIAISFVP